MTRYRDVVFKYRGDRFLQNRDAEAQLEQVQGHPLTVTKVDRKEERSQPPQLYDLTELQRSMNGRFGLSADATLRTAQALYEDHELSAGEIRELLQHGVLKRPIELAGVGRVILSMSASGAVTDIPVPERKPRSGNAERKRSDSTRTRKRPARRVAEKPDLAPSAGLGNCPLCGAGVWEQRKSYSCSGWKKGCKFVIWKTIAGKRIGVRTAKTLLTKGETSRLKGFKSKAGKPFDARLKLVDGKLQFDYSP